MGRLGLPGMGLQNRRPTAVWLPSELSGLVLWLRADQGITLNGSDVQKWDCISTAAYGEQLTPANQPVFVASHANLRGRAAVHSTLGVTEELDMSFDTTSQVDWTCFFVYDAGGTAASYYLWDANGADRVIMTHTGSGTTTSDYYTLVDGWETGPAATAAVQCLAFRLESGVNGTVWRNGTSLATGTYASKRRVQNGTLLKGNQNDIYLAEVITYNRALTAGEMALVFTYTAARYGL